MLLRMGQVLLLLRRVRPWSSFIQSCSWPPEGIQVAFSLPITEETWSALQGRWKSTMRRLGQLSTIAASSQVAMFTAPLCRRLTSARELYYWFLRAEKPVRAGILHLTL